MKKLLFHVHSDYSYDCDVRPEKIVDFAVKNNIDYLVIADHDSSAGSVCAKNYASIKKINIQIPISAEYLTDIGDIIAVNLPETFNEIFDHKVLCEVVKENGGHIILPHPFKAHRLDKIDYTNIDYIEVFNSRCSLQENKNALLLAKDKNKKFIYGSDAHFLKSSNNVITVYDNNNNPFRGRIMSLKLSYAGKDKIHLSQLIKSKKTKDLRLCIISMLRIIKYYGAKIIHRTKVY